MFFVVVLFPACHVDGDWLKIGWSVPPFFSERT